MKKLGAIEDDIILLAGLGLAGYWLYTKISGSGTDPVITNQANVTPSQNPFSYQFQPFIDFFNNNTPILQGTTNSAGPLWFFPFGGGGATTTITSPTIQQFFGALKSNPPTSSVWGYINTVDLSKRAEQLYSAINVSSLNPLSMSDQTSAMSALAGLSNQLQLAFIANYFWWNFNTDLLTFLQGSLFKPGLTSDNLVSLIQSVNGLPINP